MNRIELKAASALIEVIELARSAHANIWAVDAQDSFIERSGEENPVRRKHQEECLQIAKNNLKKAAQHISDVQSHLFNLLIRSHITFETQ